MLPGGDVKISGTKSALLCFFFVVGMLRKQFFVLRLLDEIVRDVLIFKRTRLNTGLALCIANRSILPHG